MTPLEHAEHASWYGRVMPLSAERKPMLAFDAAARNIDEVRALWREWPRAGVGVLTDHVYCAIDLESVAKHGRDGFATIDRLQVEIGELPDTREHSTKSGGAHLIYRLPADNRIRSSQEVLRGYGPAPGVDIVAGNACMRWPGTPGYELHADRPIALMPAPWLVVLEEPLREEPEPVPRLDGDGRARRYAIVALQRCATELAECGGMRNPLLAKLAFRLGRMCPPLTEDEIIADLLLACEANGSLKEHGRRACWGTIVRQVRAGQQKPLRLVG